MLGKNELVTYLRSLRINTELVDVDFLSNYVQTHPVLDFGFLLGLAGVASLKGKELDKFARLEGLSKRRWFGFEPDSKYGPRIRNEYLNKKPVNNSSFHPGMFVH